jgi:uncharacterized membrane protein
MGPETTTGASPLTPERFFLVLALLSGLAFAAVTPPFQVPDEPVHFYRAYTVSEGRLDLLPAPGATGADLPSSLTAGDLPPLLGLRFHPERKVAPASILAALRIPLAPEKREPVFFPSSLQYTFVPYLPQAVGIALGRLLGAPALALLYCARLANLLFGTLAIACAVRRLPAYAWLAALAGLLPMSLALLASASADVTTLAAAFTLISAAARRAWGNGEPRRSDLVLLTLGSAVLCASKPPYLPLALLAFLIPAARLPRGRRGFLAAHLSLSLLMAAWAFVGARRIGPLHFDTAIDAGRQIHDSLTNPPRFFRVLAVDYALHAPRYLSQMVGKLGWLDVQLPVALIVVWLTLLGALLFLDAGPRLDVRRWQRGIAAVVTLTAMALISASQYAVWTPYGADFIQGVQGRYFLPLIPVAVWAFHRRRWAGRTPSGRLGIALAFFAVLSSGIALWSLARRYYGV